MQKLFHSYAFFSIACFVTWGVIFAIGLLFHLSHANHAPLYVFFGWVLGWLAATIARHVYDT